MFEKHIAYQIRKLDLYICKVRIIGLPIQDCYWNEENQRISSRPILVKPSKDWVRVEYFCFNKTCEDYLFCSMATRIGRIRLEGLIIFGEDIAEFHRLCRIRTVLPSQLRVTKNISKYLSSKSGNFHIFYGISQILATFGHHFRLQLTSSQFVCSPSSSMLIGR